MSTRNEDNHLSRRQALKIIAATTGAATFATLPGKWTKPILKAGVLPAHAQTSTPYNFEPTDGVAQSVIHFLEGALALDHNDNPHLVFDDGQLQYARRHNGIWAIDVLAKTTAEGHCALALDSANYPHIVYWQSINQSLIYTHRDAGGWQAETVDKGEVGIYPSLAMDSNDRPHIVYFDYQAGNLKYARIVGGIWEKHIVDGDGGVGWYPSLALDAANRPHVVYYDDFNRTLKYAYWTGSEWVIEVITTYPGYYAKLLLDAKDNPLVSYMYQYEGAAVQIKFGERVLSENGSEEKGDQYVWQVQMVAAAPQLTGQVSMSLDAQQEPHIVYYDKVGEDDPNVITYASRKDGKWVNEQLLEVNTPGLALRADSQNRLLMAHYDQDMELAFVTVREGSWLSPMPVQVPAQTFLPYMTD